MTLHDVVFRLYHLLGVAPGTGLSDPRGWPVRLGGPGRVIRGALA